MTLEEFVSQHLADAPPLSDTQRAQIGALLNAEVAS